MGKTINLEVSIPNARNNTPSSIDAVCVSCGSGDKDIKIEYKSGPTSITSKKIKEQFIERDLFNANSLDEIQWRMEVGTGFTKEKLKTMLKNQDSKDAIMSIINGSKEVKSNNVKNFFGFNKFDTVITDLHIDNFVNNNFNLIFK